MQTAIYEGILIGVVYVAAKLIVENLSYEIERGLERDGKIVELFSRLEDCEKQTADVAETSN